MNARVGRLFRLLLGITLAGCAGAAPTQSVPAAPTPSPASGPTDSPAPTERDIWSVHALGSIEPGRYFIDPDLDPSTPMRVVYEIPANGWSQWIGGAKFTDLSPGERSAGSDDQVGPVRRRLAPLEWRWHPAAKR